MPFKVEDQQITLRPSSSERWMHCTASPTYIETLRELGKLPQEEVADYTQEGTNAHYCAEMFLKDPEAKDLSHYVAEKFGFGPDAKDHNRHIMSYCKKVLELYAQNRKSVLLIEEKVPCFYDEKTFGTIDSAVVYESGRKVIITDLKYGEGVDVPAKNNPQQAIYALSFLKEYEAVYGFTDSTLIQIGIFQPRTAGEDYKMWVLTYAELVNWVEQELMPPIDTIRTNEGTKFCVSDETCRFCPAKAVCKERAKEIFGDFESEVIDDEIVLSDKPAQALQKVEQLELPNPVAMTSSQMEVALSMKKKLTSWLNHVEEFLTEEAYKGRVTLSNHKVVLSNPHRKWDDEDKALEFLRKHGKVSEVTTQKVLTPAQAEKFMKAKDIKRNKDKIFKELSSLIVKPEGAPTLAPIDDKREAVYLTAETEFEVIEDETTEPKNQQDEEDCLDIL